MGAYEQFLLGKESVDTPTGLTTIAPLNPILYQHQADMVRWALHRGRAAIFADCLAGETIIHSPDGDITAKDAFDRGTPMRVYSIENGAVVIANATAPFVAGVNDLFRFTLDSGRSIVSTKGHKFLTCEGWRTGDSLSVGDRLASSDATLLLSNSASGLLAHASGDPRWMKTPQDLTEGCSIYSRQCGEQPRPSSSICSERSPSQGDALSHIPPQFCSDGLENKSERTHPRQFGFPLSTDHSFPPAETTEEGGVSRLLSYDPSCNHGSNEIFIQAGQASILALPDPVFHPSEVLQTSVDQFVPCHDSLVEFDTLVAVDYITNGIYYDIEVPGPSCFLADEIWSHNCGLGKGPMQMEWAHQQPHECIIAAPLAVAHQFVREAEKFGIDLAYAKDQAGVTKRITVTNYERLENFHIEQFGAVALDECFPKGTLIDCVIDGIFTQKHIENIQIGDSIVNAFGVDSVADVHRREVQYGVKVYIKGRDFITSPNHPIFTQRGWVGAQDLLPGDYALEAREALSVVRDGILSKRARGESSEILRDILLSEMADDSAGSLSEGSYERSPRKDRSRKVCMASVGQPESDKGNGSNNSAESDIERRDSGENLPCIESHEAQTFRAWRKWEGNDGASSVLDGTVAARMDSGICLVTGETKGRLSDLLQARLSEQRNASVHRGGWVLSLCEKGSGREENVGGGIFRVEGIEVLEQGNPELERFRNAEGRIYFYDLGATRHPSFSVNGLLVHNSSILKSHSGAYSTWMIEAFKNAPFRLCSSATPAPNDVMELGTQAEFLGVMTRSEMLAMYFTHDGGDTSKWRVKGHAQVAFWNWLASWAVMIRKPSDLGYSDAGFTLPPLHMHEQCVKVNAPTSGFLFAVEAQTLQERQQARRESIGDRVAACAAIVNASDKPFLVWCNLNSESEALAAAIPGAVEVQGSDTDEHKERAIAGFLDGSIRVIVSKPRILGLGLNLQCCADMAYVGLSDSYEQLYQSIRRCWRFGQDKPVNVHIITAETEGAVVSNIKRKEREANETYDNMIEHMKDLNSAALHGGTVRNKTAYSPTVPMVLPSFLAV